MRWGIFGLFFTRTARLPEALNQSIVIEAVFHRHYILADDRITKKTAERQKLAVEFGMVRRPPNRRQCQPETMCRSNSGREAADVRSGTRPRGGRQRRDGTVLNESHSFSHYCRSLGLVGVLSAELEGLGMKNHPYVARVLSAIAVSLAAYTQHWLALVIVVILAAITLLYLLVRRD
jgi:hypothetical protein